MTGLIFKIESSRMEQLLSLDFYIERDSSITIYKDDLVKVFLGDKVEHYAVVDANKLGRGNIICRAQFADYEVMYADGVRPVVACGFTGYTIPCMGEGKTISCGEYEVAFTKVSDIPQGEAMIYYGISDLDNPDLRDFVGVKEISEIEFTFNAGDSIVVAIPKDRGMVAKKNDGFGGRIDFSEEIKGANGKDTTLLGLPYKVYGEFMAVEGRLKVYIV